MDLRLVVYKRLPGDNDYAFVRQMSVLLSHKENADYLQIRLLKSTYFIDNAAVIHMSERLLSVHYYKEFSSSSVKYPITDGRDGRETLLEPAK